MSVDAPQLVEAQCPPSTQAEIFHRITRVDILDDPSDPLGVPVFRTYFHFAIAPEGGEGQQAVVDLTGDRGIRVRRSHPQPSFLT